LLCVCPPFRNPGAGSAEEPTLDLESEPSLDQANFLAVLLFGKPASELEWGGIHRLREQRVGLRAALVGRKKVGLVVCGVGCNGPQSKTVRTAIKPIFGPH
jgi:hypothetical protein